ncbi:MAG: hypothetical protein WD738_19345 [Pirellulales bacterium]
MLRIEPFGENVEGLSLFADKSCVIQLAVQKVQASMSGRTRVGYNFNSNIRMGSSNLVASSATVSSCGAKAI